MCDCELPSAYVETKRRARKDHRCVECERTIRAGSEYLYISGVWDREGQSFKCCLRCADVRTLVQGLDDGCECVAFGHLIGTIGDLDLLRLRPSSTHDAEAMGAAAGLVYSHLLDNEDAWQR
jgi:hypothetical protein